MEYIWFWIIVGIVAGALANRVVPGGGLVCILGNLIRGVVGAFLGGWLFTTFLGNSFSGWIGSTLVAFVGAIILLLLARAVTGKRAVV